jgi:hypothetical protein
MAAELQTDPDKTLALVAEMDTAEPEMPVGSNVAYVCPMNPDVTSGAAARCPKCGLKLSPPK